MKWVKKKKENVLEMFFFKSLSMRSFVELEILCVWKGVEFYELSNLLFELEFVLVCNIFEKGVSILGG